MDRRRTQIVVVGGGAGGLELVRKLARHFGRESHDVLLVDRHRTHVWKPLLHEVAAGSLDPNLDEVGYGGHAARWGYRYFNGTLDRIDRERQVIVTAPLLDEDGEVIVSRHEIRYDYLVLAIGGVSNDLGIPGVADHALFLEHRRQADRFRHKLLNACLRINDARETGQGAPDLPICIVGGGATGVELAAELLNAAKALRSYGLEDFDETALKVTLIEAGPRILPALSPELSGNATSELQALGIDVRCDTRVTRVWKDRVETGGGDAIEARMILWAAGVRGDRSVARMGDLELTRLDQIVVRPTLQIAGDDRVYAIGDCAHCVLPGAEAPVPPRAQAAHQMASHVARNIAWAEAGKPLADFVYRDHGALVSLSRFDTVGSLMGNLVGGRMAIRGRLARLAYNSLYRMHILAVHGWLRGAGMILVGHVNRIVRPRLKLH